MTIIAAEARSWIKRAQSSSAECQIFEIEDTASGDIFDAYLKCPTLGVNSPIGTACVTAEVFGLVLAREFGMRTVDPVIVNVSPEVSRDALQRGGRIPPGFWGGSISLPGMTSIAPAFTRKDPALLDSLVQLWCLDSMLLHSDRRWQRPNCAMVSGELVCFDFDKALMAPCSLLPTEKCWELFCGQAHKDEMKNHLGHPYRLNLKTPIDLHQIALKTQAWNQKMLYDIVSAMPDEWKASADAAMNFVVRLTDDCTELGVALTKLAA